jgi:hypothetical protein
MANRTFQNTQALEKEVKTLFAKVSIGATGAPTLVQPGSLGIASVVRVSAGLYRFTLVDAFPKLLAVKPMLLSAAAEDLTFQVKLETVATTKLIEVMAKTGATATDPANGDVLMFEFVFKNTTVPY